ncbi:ABC transporter permease [Microbacterium jejuense]|uniref:ABC transporter permease n=1 Tax=Microbacterium jejuense TaxID=1263637 RepID=UPI0031EB3190
MGPEHAQHAADGLYEVGRRPPLGAYLAEAWRRRSFALRLAGYRLVGGLLRNRLGLLWIVLRPLLMAIMYGTIFHFVLSGSARPQDFVQYLLVGVFIFEFFTGSFGGGAKAITGNAKLVQSLGFPRILLPVSIVAEQAMRMIPVLVLLGILLVVLGEPITWSWLAIIPILSVMAIFNLGAALIVARMSVHARDVQQIIPIINRVLFYVTGIFFNVDGALAGYPVALTIAHLVPTYGFIAISRDVMLQSYTAPTLAWIAAPAWAIIAIVVGVIYFWQAEARYGLSD